MKRREEFTVGSRPTVDVRLQSGRVFVENGPIGEIVVELDGRFVSELDVSQTGDGVTVRRPPGDRAFGKGSVRARIVAPPGTDLLVAGASCDVVARGRYGAVEVKTASGDVSLDTAGRAEVKTASGDVAIERVEGRIQISSASGEVRLGHAAGDVAAALASGDLVADVVGGSLKVATASGDVRVERFEGDEVRVRSVSGDVDLGLVAGIRLDLSVNTLAGDVRLPDEAVPADGPAANRKVRVSASTVSGDVILRRV